MHCRLLAASMLAFFSLSGAATAGDCPGNPDAIGTSRVLAIDPVEFQKLGTIQYKQTLPLEDHEVVLTFDDGPIPPHTDKVLDALAAECVKATFFVVGEMARAHPAALQREHAEGHTIGTHTEHHARLDRLPTDKAEKEISEGLASVAGVLNDKAAVAPFFRFPYLDQTGAVEDRGAHLGLSIWSADFHGSDWTFITPEKVNALSLSRLEAKKKGILLLHDIHERTAKALPVLLRELKKRGYRIVQVVPANGAVAKIEDKAVDKAKTEQAALVKPVETTKTEQAALVKPEEKAPANQVALVKPDEKAPADIEHAAPATPKKDPGERTRHWATVSVERKSQKNGESGWHTHVKNHKQTASAKDDPFKFLFHPLWQR